MMDKFNFFEEKNYVQKYLNALNTQMQTLMDELKCVLKILTWLTNENQSFTPGEGNSCDVTPKEKMDCRGQCSVHLGFLGTGRLLQCM